MYGDFVVMIAVAVFMLTINFFSFADTSLAALPRRVRGEGWIELIRQELAASRARRIFDVFDFVERHIHELAADLLYPPDIDGLHHVTCIGIDRHRSARALPLQSFGRRDQ